MERIRAAVLLPVRIDVKDVYDETCTELRVTAALDSGGRGRPRVTYDVTAALANMGAPHILAHAHPWGMQGSLRRDLSRAMRLLHPKTISWVSVQGCGGPVSATSALLTLSIRLKRSALLHCTSWQASVGGARLQRAAPGCAGLYVFMADVYMEAQCSAEDTPPQELHRFLVHCPDGGRLESVSQKRCVPDSPLRWPPLVAEYWWPDWIFDRQLAKLQSICDPRRM